MPWIASAGMNSNSLSFTDNFERAAIRPKGPCLLQLYGSPFSSRRRIRMTKLKKSYVQNSLPAARESLSITIGRLKVTLKFGDLYKLKTRASNKVHSISDFANIIKTIPISIITHKYWTDSYRQPPVTPNGPTSGDRINN